MESKVAIVRIKEKAGEAEIEGAVFQAIQMLGGPEQFCRNTEVVFVKPNWGEPSKRGQPTFPVVYETLKIFSHYGCKVWIGEDPAVVVQEKTIYKAHRAHELAEKTKSTLVSLRNGPHRMVEVPNAYYFKNLEISNYALDAQLVVSVAKMKVVNITDVSLSLKNMKGVIPPPWKQKLHCEGLNQGIVDINRVVRPGLAVIDGIAVEQGNTGIMQPVGIIVASNDCVAADSVCTRILGLDPQKVDHIVLAEKAGLGTTNISKMTILGEKLEDLVGKYTFPAPANPLELIAKSKGKIRLIQGNPCSSCLNELGYALKNFQDRLEDFDDLTIMVGGKAKIPKGVKNLILMGKCLEKVKDEGLYVPGCPPTSFRPAKTGSLTDALKTILKAAGIKK